MDSFVQLINEVGFPIAAAIGLGLFIWKLINKIIDVIKVSDLTEGDHHEYEFIMIKFRQSKKIQKILKGLNGIIHEKNKDVMVMSAWGPSGDIEIAIKAIGKANLLEIARSGSIGLHEGEKILKI